MNGQSSRNMRCCSPALHSSPSLNLLVLLSAIVYQLKSKISFDMLLYGNDGTMGILCWFSNESTKNTWKKQQIITFLALSLFLYWGQISNVPGNWYISYLGPLWTLTLSAKLWPQNFRPLLWVPTYEDNVRTWQINLRFYRWYITLLGPINELLKLAEI